MLLRLVGSISLRSLIPPWMVRSTPCPTIAASRARPLASTAAFAASAVASSVAAIRTLRRSEEHTSELQSRQYFVCRLLLEKKSDTAAGGAAVDQRQAVCVLAEHVRERPDEHGAQQRTPDAADAADDDDGDELDGWHQVRGV